MSTLVKCPTCDRAVEWTEAFPWRPFCSERCKLIDLGAWASEKHAIPLDTAEPEDLPPTHDDED
jgi:uncharacterized protein